MPCSLSAATTVATSDCARPDRAPFRFHNKIPRGCPDVAGLRLTVNTGDNRLSQSASNTEAGRHDLAQE